MGCKDNIYFIRDKKIIGICFPQKYNFCRLKMNKLEQ